MPSPTVRLQLWSTEDGDVVIIGTHDIALATRMLAKYQGCPVVGQMGTSWVLLGQNEHGEFWEHVQAGTPGALPACTWG
ncbi:hypothetical protein [Amycolatopsis sp. ATCC 39116]|uniref:hypothetical protein n=1 Tax=Amycolatopsis sp. (strain ATCC 39116 / 75iv2) TaxID=385957 RepID=UPI0002DBC84B|nr:hypothetical protein [Amycolatopsis sp. ATCC 39116]